MKKTNINDYIKVDNLRVYNLKEAAIASGFPMATSFDADKFDEATSTDLTFNELKRMGTLGACKPASGHDCFAKAILTTFNLTAPQYVWQQAKRYGHFDIGSSQSTMHKILKFDIKKSCTPGVIKQVIEALNEFIGLHNNWDNMPKDAKAYAIMGVKEKYGVVFDDKESLFDLIVENIPSGLKLTVHISTNYLQLKTIIGQRKRHKMKEWQHFCDYMLANCDLLDYIIKPTNSKS